MGRNSRSCRVVLVVSAALVLAAGCSGGGSDRSSAKAPPKSLGEETAAGVAVDAEWKPNNTYEALAAGIVDGKMPLEQALQLFALQYGPIPGVRVPGGKRGPAREGNLAISSVLGVWGELDVEQQAAVRTALDLPDGFDPTGGDPGGSAPTSTVPATTTQTGTVPAGTVSTSVPDGQDDPSGVGMGGEHPGVGAIRTASMIADMVRRVTDGPGVEAYRASLEAIRPVVERHLGPLGIPVVIGTASPGVGDTVEADTVVMPLGGEGRTCRIRVFPHNFPAPRGASVTMAHELIHCYQQVWTETNPPAWIADGLAEWGGMTALVEAGGGVGHQATADWFANYYQTPSRKLFDRSYDAVAWWAHLQEQGADVWAKLRQASTAPSSVAAYQIAVAGAGPGAIDEWGTAQLDARQLGERWVISGPGVPTVPNALSVRSRLANGGSVQVSSPEYASARTARILDGDLLKVEVSASTAGYLRIGDTDHRLAELTGMTWCTRSSGECVCPPNTRRAGERFARLGSGTAYVGASGGPVAGNATLTAVSLEDECQRRTNCLIGTWTQDGPPANDLFTTVSGGGGATVTFSPEGRVTFDFSAMQPWKASPRSDPSGVITARLDGSGSGNVEYPEPPSSTAAVTVADVDMSSVTGSASMQVNGVDVGSIGDDLVRQLWGAAEGSSWTVASCEGDTMTMSAGPGVATYHRRS